MHKDAKVIDVAMDVADLLVSMGMPLNDVVQLSSEVCKAQASRWVHVDAATTMIVFSQDGTDTDPPFTQMRPVQARPLDYAVMQQVVDGVAELSAGKKTLEALEDQCHKLMSPRSYSSWRLMLSAGTISAACCLLFGASLPVLLATFLIGCLGERVATVFSVWGLPALVSQASAAFVITMTSITTAKIGTYCGVPMEAESLIVGGIVMLVVGMKFVAAFLDALDGYYVSAAAGILRVAMLTAGIVMGILIALWLLIQMGVSVGLGAEQLGLGQPFGQVLGAAIIAGAYAWYCHSSVPGVIVSVCLGAVTWIVFMLVWRSGIAEVPASGIASVLAGIAAATLSKRWRIPSLALMTAGIVTMVPGLRLYMGLMQAVSAPLWTPAFFDGITTLLVAVGIGLAIAVGASVGVVLGRPLRKSIHRVTSYGLSRRDDRAE